LVIAFCLLAAAGSRAAVDAPARAQKKMDGWGPFKFGMTPEQARAVPGVSWRRDINTPIMVMMHSLPMTSEYAPDTDVMLTFNADQKLMAIHLLFKGTQSAADCDKAFQNLLTRLDAKYGAFAPGGDRDLEWFTQDVLVRGGLLEDTSALKLSGSRSRYWRRTVLPNISGINLEAEAKRSFGSRSIEALMFQKDGSGKDGNDGCHRTVAFSADMPTKAQLEMQYKLSHVPAGMDWHWAELDRLGRGFSSVPAQPVFSTGTAENVRLSGSRFAADVKPPPGSRHAGTMHLVGTISDNKITAHIPASDTVPDDFPTSFEGSISMFTTDGEPVDTYEIRLTGTTRWGSTTLGMAAYHRNSPHAPTPQACRNISESVFATRRTVREMTYKGLIQALGCPPS